MHSTTIDSCSDFQTIFKPLSCLVQHIYVPMISQTSMLRVWKIIPGKRGSNVHSALEFVVCFCGPGFSQPLSCEFFAESCRFNQPIMLTNFTAIINSNPATFNSPSVDFNTIIHFSRSVLCCYKTRWGKIKYLRTGFCHQLFQLLFG